MEEDWCGGSMNSTNPYVDRRNTVTHTSDDKNKTLLIRQYLVKSLNIFGPMIFIIQNTVFYTNENTVCS